MSRCNEATVGVRLNGGLGNHLFQYAAGLSVAKRVDARIQIINIEDAHPLLETLLGRKLCSVPASWNPPAVMPTIARRGLRRLHRSWQDQGRSHIRVDQQANSALDAVNGSLDDLSAPQVTLDGFFQHPSWYGRSVKDIATRVHRFLRSQPEYDLGIESNVISFRRGDYVRYGWDLSASYYLRAIERLPIDHRRIWVIGDDQLFNVLAAQWLQSRGLDAAPAPSGVRNAEVRDACLLASARSVVMSNSTFCWWAVTAREHVDRPTKQHVLAPDRWLPFASTNPLLSAEWHPLLTTFGSEPEAQDLIDAKLFVARQ